MANLEDSVTALEKKFNRFQETYASYLDQRERWGAATWNLS